MVTLTPVQYSSRNRDVYIIKEYMTEMTMRWCAEA